MNAQPQTMAGDGERVVIVAIEPRKSDGGRPSRLLSTQLGVLTSAVVHLGLLIVVALLLQPLNQGPGGPVSVHLEVSEAAPPLEVIPPEEPRPEFAEPLFTMTASADDLVSDLIAVKSLARGTRAGPPSSSGGDDEGWNAGPRGTFFGTVATGGRIVYVLDISTSMNAVRNRTTGATRLECAMDELLYSVEQLRADQHFYVLLFCGRTRWLFDKKSLLPTMVPATPENKRRLRKWLGTINAGPYTDPRVALHVALKMRASDVFLLSDGEFNRGKERSPVLQGNPSVNDVVEASNSDGIPIHTFAFEDRANRKNMEALAVGTGGEYRFIPPMDNKRARALGGADSSANRMLRRAQYVQRQQGLKRAVRRYRRIVDRFPKSDEAREAQKRLAEWDRRSRP